MFKLIHTSSDKKSISIQNLETGETKAFSKVLVDSSLDEDGLPITIEIGENPNFKKEVEDFAGVGFLNE